MADDVCVWVAWPIRLRHLYQVCMAQETFFYELKYLERKPQILYPERIGIWSVGFGEGRKTGRRTGKQPRSKARTNHNLNPHLAPGRFRTRQSHIGERRALSPLRHPCSPPSLIRVAHRTVTTHTHYSFLDRIK